MSGIFGTLNTANKGLIAQQTALHTTSHNISNANTEGYSRQRVDLKADLAYNFAGVGQLGTGVKMESIVRMVDDYVNKQIRQENGTLERFTTKSEVMGQLEIIFNEPSDTGLNFNLGEMFEAWQELSKNPESLNSKTIVVEKSKTLAETLNHMSNQINNLRDNTIAELEKNVLDFNTTITKLDTLNKQIFNISVKGQVPNDLLDQRDLLLKDLSSITDFEADFSDKFGRVMIKVGGNQVLTENEVNKMLIDNAKPPVITIDKGLFNPLAIKTGQIKGNMEGLKDLDDILKGLNDFVKLMAENINGAHINDEHGNPIPGIEPIFVTYDSAGNIKVNDEILKDPSNIIAGATPSSPVGDGSRALEISRLRNVKLPGGTTIEGAYRDIVTKIGISKEHSDNMVSNQEILIEQLVLRRESTSGVSIDEEISNLVKFQKSFDANAKVISVLADMLDTLINRTGV